MHKRIDLYINYGLLILYIKMTIICIYEYMCVHIYFRVFNLWPTIYLYTIIIIYEHILYNKCNLVLDYDPQCIYHI